MPKTILAAILVSTGLAGSALAQAPTGPFMTEQAAGEFRASKFVGLDVYDSDNEKIGDVREILIAADGQARGVVLGVGGFLRIGEKNVAVAWSALTWSSDRPAARAATISSPATTGSTIAAATIAGSPATTAPARSPTEPSASNGSPDHATVRLTKADLQNAPAFKYSAETHSSAGTPSGASPPARP